MSTLVPTVAKNDYAEKVRSICYESKCKKVKNKVILTIIIDEKEVICPEKGGIISMDNFEGFIECPSSKEICVGQLNEEIGKSEFSFFNGLSEKLLKVVLEFIDWIYNNGK